MTVFEYSGLQAERLGFWICKQMWPMDTDPYMFLGRAMQICGKAIFPDDWNGHELHERFRKKPRVDQYPNLTELDRSNARDLIGQFEGLGPPADEGFYPTLGEWKRYCEYDALIADSLVASFERVRTVMSFLQKQIAEGKISSVVREIEGDGQFRSVPIERWRSDSSTAFFIACLMSYEKEVGEASAQVPPAVWTEHPESAAHPERWPHYIFVHRGDLVAVLKREFGHRHTKVERNAPFSEAIEFVKRHVEHWESHGRAGAYRSTRERLEACAVKSNIRPQRIRDIWKPDSSFNRGQNPLIPLEWRRPGPAGPRQDRPDPGRCPLCGDLQRE